jgi:hypothetical protein
MQPDRDGRPTSLADTIPSMMMRAAAAPGGHVFA